MKEKFRDKKWYPYTVAACFAVVLYVALTHLSVILGVAGTFIGYFKAIIIGGVFAYLMNPLAKWYNRTVFGKMTNKTLQWSLSVVLTLLTMVVLLVFLLGTLIPQIADSISRLVSNMDTYLASFESLLDNLGLSDNIHLDKIINDLFGTNGKVITYLKNNISNILSVSAAAGKSVVNVGIAIILSIYMLMSKDSIREVVNRLLCLLMSEKAYRSTVRFMSRCDNILVQYIVFSLLDAVIIGVINAIFMLILRMEYIGLVSLIVGVCNLIPTFGPVIGAVIGGFILLLVNPWHALMFIAFTLLLQLIDGYILKPKLFSGSLGVSGLLILASVIVCGNIFGIIGILLSIPLAAVLDFVYDEVLIPALEKRSARKKQITAAK